MAPLWLMAFHGTAWVLAVVAAGMFLLMMLVPFVLAFVSASALLGLSVGVMSGVLRNSRTLARIAGTAGVLVGLVAGYLSFSAGLGGGSAKDMTWTWYGGDLSNSLYPSAGMAALGGGGLWVAVRVRRGQAGRAPDDPAGDARSATVACPECGGAIPPKAAKCPSCGWSHS